MPFDSRNEVQNAFYYVASTIHQSLVKGRAVELRTADGRSKILRAAGSRLLALTAPAALGAQAWVAPGGQTTGGANATGRV